MFIRETLLQLKADINSHTMIVGNFNIPLLAWTDHPNLNQTNAIAVGGKFLQLINTFNKARAKN